MITFGGKVILLDIEGTVSPLAFVHDVMFPYARQHAGVHLAKHWGTAVIAQLARDAGVPSFASPAEAEAVVHRLMDEDAKVTGLKQLQGMIWEEGFRNGELRSRIFDDVPIALASWCRQGIEIRIYSSGSVHAQKLFFAHTKRGDLTPHFSGYYDTTTGSKRESASYTAIAADCGLPADQILFVSDLVEELNAARNAGMFTALAVRPGNKPAPPHDHPAITSFSEIALL
ncbi:MAG: acireductone synthase [Prosthecobacter sp.]|uniref:acireductone synthase n=1 Tax=Prosthecobacter sp. TaxID=1965333 RepID=UPI0025CF3A35|nr:acireductone synthase [Prosthecobacter sp.]MCF7785030.1 acireductone synthase [Prosthecobacter sp.]